MAKHKTVNVRPPTRYRRKRRSKQYDLIDFISRLPKEVDHTVT